MSMIEQHRQDLGTRALCEALEVPRASFYRQRSPKPPTALAVTLQMLRANEARPLEEVFHREALAAHFMITHPDYLEGIRARIIDKDDQPRWQPESIKAFYGS